MDTSQSQEISFARPALPIGTVNVAQDRDDDGLAQTFSRSCLRISQRIWMDSRNDSSRWRNSADCKKFREAVGHLVLWGQSSTYNNLDERLEAREELRGSILELLLGLGRVLNRWQAYYQPKDSNRRELENLATSIERTEFLVNGGEDSNESSAQTDESSEEESSNKSIEDRSRKPPMFKSTLVEEFLTYTTCLMDLVPSIEDIDPNRESHKEATASQVRPTNAFSTSEAAQVFATKILDKFPEASQDLVHKLATWNLSRSLRIIRAQNRQSQVSNSSVATAQPLPTKAPSSVAPSSFRDSGVGTSVGTASQYAQTIGSSASDAGGEILRVPPMPKGFDGSGRPFNCHICGKRCSGIFNRADWKKHVHFDLATYTCLRHPLGESVAPFRTRAELAVHEFEEHRSRRLCTECDKSFDTKDAWKAHRQEHLAEDPLPPGCILVPSKDFQEPCPLCKSNIGASQEDFANHLGRHLEQIALASLPRNALFEDDHDSLSEDDEIKSTVTLTSLGRPPDPPIPRLVYPSPSTFVQKHPATFQCHMCPKKFTRAYNLRSHLRTHTDERPFVCRVCGKAFARQHDRKRHEGLHDTEIKSFVCKGYLENNITEWGCGRRFAKADALGRHFRSEAGRTCIQPLLDEDAALKAVAAHSQASARGSEQAVNAPIFPQALVSQFPELEEAERQDHYKSYPESALWPIEDPSVEEYFPQYLNTPFNEYTPLKDYVQK